MKCCDWYNSNRTKNTFIIKKDKTNREERETDIEKETNNYTSLYKWREINPGKQNKNKKKRKIRKKMRTTKQTIH